MREGGRCPAVRAATSMRRVGVKRRRARGLPRVAGGCEGDRVHSGACGRRALLVAARNLAGHSAARGDHAHAIHRWLAPSRPRRRFWAGVAPRSARPQVPLRITRLALAVGVPRADPLEARHRRGPASLPRDERAARRDPGRSCHGHRQTRELPHLPPLLRHPSSWGAATISAPSRSSWAIARCSRP